MDVMEILTWLIPAGPLLAFAVILLLTKQNRTLSFLIAWAGIITALVLSWIVSFSVFGDFLADLHEVEEHPVRVSSSIAWLPIGDYYGEPVGASFVEGMAEEAHGAEEESHGEEAEEDSHGAAEGEHGEKAVPDETKSGTWFRIGVSADPLTAVMLFMVPFAVFMIFVYSVGYHNYGNPRGKFLGIPNHGMEEPMFSRFFAMMSLFAGAMLILVVSDNLLTLFVGWEIMGFCSYSLIGFWYARKYDDPKKTPPREAAIKAFMTTRIADVVMLMGIVFFYRTFGTLNFETALSAESLQNAIQLSSFGAVGLGIMALMIFTGTVGKSAQFPFHVWLPDAMEGPTPVSAVIHAAAMVSAGIYLILRIFPLIAVALKAAPAFGWTIAFIGAFTALMSATIAVAQNDVKGVLAYSTISQLGFMVAAIGVGGYIAAAFHLITHAFFKALLFLCSGSVIHGMEHGAEHVHDHHSDPQDMRLMGGLAQKMPTTFWAFLIGGMALSGFPLVTAGFWSKDEIFAEAWYNWSNDANPIGLFVFAMLALAAFLTAFYTMRQLALTFAGKPRSPLAEHAHESNGFMTTPLVLLSFFAITAGWVGIPDNFLGTAKGSIFYNYFHHFVGATIYVPLEVLYNAEPEKLVLHEIFTLPWSWIPLTTSVVVALGGLGLGYLVYWRKPLEEGQPDPMIAFLTPALHNFLHNKWYWDELYRAVFVKPAVYFSEVVVYQWIDRGGIDGLLHLIARVFYTIGEWFRRAEIAVFNDAVDWLTFRFRDLGKEFRAFQTGKVQEYALASVLVAVIFTAFIYGASQGWFDGVLFFLAFGN
ncbi:MAG: NADH-quinone oxidoreductase subunit L [Ardenticatenaceae bacterium]|nr:NADH-quinone oxidoreductase subunit L [Ardenticatenaceae bacterium]